MIVWLYGYMIILCSLVNGNMIIWLLIEHWLYNNMIIWLYDYIIIWLFGCVIIWLNDNSLFIDQWQYDNMIIWLYGYMVIWLLIEHWLCDCMLVRLYYFWSWSWLYDNMIVWVLVDQW